MRRALTPILTLALSVAPNLARAGDPEPLRLYVHVVLDDTGECVEIHETYDLVYESQAKVASLSDLRKGRRLTLALVDGHGTASNDAAPRCLGKRASYEMPAVYEKDKGPAGFLERRPSGAYVHLDLPLVQDDGGGELGGCQELHYAELEITEEELQHWSTLEKTSVFHGQPDAAEQGCKGQSVSTFRTRPLEDDGEVEVQGPSCICEQDLKGELTASGPEGGTFRPFEIRPSSDARPDVHVNEGGASPKLVLVGAGGRTAQVDVVAVYEKDGKTLRSKPHTVHFAQVDEVVLKENIWRQQGADWCFDEDGGLEIEAEGSALMDGKDVSDLLEWEVSRNTDGLLRPEPAPGGRVKLVASSQPKQNDAFGEHEIDALLRENGCECRSRRKKVRLFFPRDATSNPEGKLPNWVYYWRQTSAGKEEGRPIVFDYVEHMPPVINCVGLAGGISDPDPRAAARYEFCNGNLYVTPIVVQPGGCAPRRYPPADEGIDCFAVTLRHENQHRLELTAWWGPAMRDYTRTRDGDGDLVPGEIEDATPGCDSNFVRSCPGRPSWIGASLMDVEFDAYKVGWRWRQGAADAEDWACPGKQCKLGGGTQP